MTQPVQSRFAARSPEALRSALSAVPFSPVGTFPGRALFRKFDFEKSSRDPPFLTLAGQIRREWLKSRYSLEARRSVLSAVPLFFFCFFFFIPLKPSVE